MLGDEAVKPLLWGLNAVALRQQVTAQNIANANTPGYKRQMVTFTKALDDEMMGDGTGIGDPARAPMPQSGPEWDLGIQFAKADFDFDKLWSADSGKQPVLPARPEADAFTATIVTDPGAMRIDGNGVVIEKEIGDMNKNVGNYNLLATRTGGEFKILTTILQAR
jgi:flagellar basal body rod protein FlgB